MIQTRVFGKTSDGRDVLAFTIKDGQNEATILNLGGIILSLRIADASGNPVDVVLGYDDVEGYEKNEGYLGALIGRVGNRIEKGRLVIDGETYNLYCNDRGNHLHGGKVGFDKKIWAHVFEGPKGNILSLSSTSADMEENYPGNMRMQVTYTFENGELKIDYAAMADKKTAVNMTNHAYFNIGNDDTVLDQELMINASRITPVDDELIPHNDFMDIVGTPFSFKNGELLKTNMFSSEHMIAAFKGFDLNYCLDRKTAKDIEHFAYVYDKASGRRMDCYTDLPGVQLYTSNTMKGTQGKKTYEDYCALCLETQCFPNSPNCPDYPSAVLKAGEPYRTTTIYKFSVK